MIKKKNPKKKLEKKLSSEELKNQFKNSMNMLVQAELVRINEQVKTKATVDPEFIQWENIGYTSKQKFRRKLLTVILTVFLIVSTKFVTIIVNGLRTDISSGMIQDCSRLDISREQAYKDVVLNQDREIQDFQLMNCFCYN